MNLVVDASPPPGVAIRQHLAEQFRVAILRGQIKAGEAFPSTRVIASTLGISRGTAVSVLEDLAGEGYLTIRPGSGTFVSEDFPPQEPPIELGELESDGISDPPLAAVAPSSTVVTSANINLWPGSPSTRFLENREWKTAWRAALTQVLPAIPPGAAGAIETRRLIAEHLASARGIHCSAEQIVLTAGTSDGISLLVQALNINQQGRLRIATEDPGYPAARNVITRLGAQAVPIPVRDGGMDHKELAASPGSFAAALLTPSHQYPLGGRLSVAARLSLLEWAEREDAILIEDDYDSEFRHGAPALQAIASLDTNNRVIHVGSYSKTLTPWLRCGYLIVPGAALRSQILAIRDDLGHPVSGITQIALAEFMHRGGLKRHLVRVGREYAHRRTLVIAATESLAPRVRLHAIEGGLHAVLSWAGAPRTEEVTAKLLERSIRVAPLPDYYHPDSPRMRQGIVFGYGAPTDLQLQTALEAIVAALR